MPFPVALKYLGLVVSILQLIFSLIWPLNASRRLFTLNSLILSFNEECYYQIIYKAECDPLIANVLNRNYLVIVVEYLLVAIQLGLGLTMLFSTIMDNLIILKVWLCGQILSVVLYFVAGGLSVAYSDDWANLNSSNFLSSFLYEMYSGGISLCVIGVLMLIFLGGIAHFWYPAITNRPLPMFQQQKFLGNQYLRGLNNQQNMQQNDHQRTTVIQHHQYQQSMPAMNQGTQNFEAQPDRNLPIQDNRPVYNNI